MNNHTFYATCVRFYATQPFAPPSHGLEEDAPWFYEESQHCANDAVCYHLTRARAEQLYATGMELQGTETIEETIYEDMRELNDTLRASTTRLAERLTYQAHSPYVVLCIEPEWSYKPVVMVCRRSLVLFFLHENRTAPALAWPRERLQITFRLTESDVRLVEVLDYHYEHCDDARCRALGDELVRQMTAWIGSSTQRRADYDVFCRDLASTRPIVDVVEETRRLYA